ncbi:MAG TPA: VTT domain-containing protein [Patescibacteria group bacterium]
MSFLSPLIHWLENLAQQIPLPWFAFIGSFIEELIAPIPSPLVMTTSGSIASSQSWTLLGLGAVAVIGAFGKMIASYFIYVVSDKGEDFVIKNFGRFIGVSHKEIESLGSYLNKGWRDDIVLFLLRAIPIVPTAPISVICGVIKLNLRTYLVSSFLGNIVRNCFYLYLGYVSLDAVHSLEEGLDSIEKVMQLLMAVVLGVAVLWFYKKRQSEGGVDGFLQKIQKMVK